MDNLKSQGKFFGELSYDSFKNADHRNGGNNIEKDIKERLSLERIKALEALQKYQIIDTLNVPHCSNNGENSKSVINGISNNSSKRLDHTDYVPFRRPNPINISELVTDETIHLGSSPLAPPSAMKDTNISFEPTEITGRSTLYKDKAHKNDEAGGTDDVYKTKNISVSDILASSFAPKARNLCETLQSADTTTLDYSLSYGLRSRASTSVSSCNGSKSLPRTADLSFSKNICGGDSFNGAAGTFSFSTTSNCLDEAENFAPGELMQSKLINDEISWAQKYAAIPVAALSEEAKRKALQNSGIISNDFDSLSSMNSMLASDPNFSVGKFFNMRSENIWNIVKLGSPNKCHTPVALVVEDDNTVTTSSDLESSSKISVTPRIDNKTYSRLGAFTNEIDNIASLQTAIVNSNHESKDSGNSSDNSYLLSISAIDRALCNLDIQSDASGIGVSQQLLKQGKNSKSSCVSNNEAGNGKCKPSVEHFKREFLGNECNGDKKVNELEQMIFENKENLDPKNKRISGSAALCDTMSFNESLLNSTDMKNLQCSIVQPRSPLSPIEVSTVNTRTSLSPGLGAEGDTDEWPSTPLTSNRRLRRTKSPRDETLLKTNNYEKVSPNVRNPTASELLPVDRKDNKNESEKQSSVSSTARIDGADRNSNTDCGFVISPNISNGDTYISSIRRSDETSPHSNNSPMSSPGSSHLSQVSSPTQTNSQFHLDATTTSDRQLLGTVAARKVVSSPVGSEASSTCSCGTVHTFRSTMSGTAAARSISRCSSSSEFSHREGKQIPLKVSKTEISWGSIKLRTDSRRSMQIKNIINKRLVLRLEISGPGFQIVNYQRSHVITLHSQECRAVRISFCPTVRGMAIGKLSFFAPCGAHITGNSFLEVPLYGYGGNASIIPQNICTGPVGSPFVTMGDVCELTEPLERTVSFYNKGSLLGFVFVTVGSIGLMPRLSDAFEIHPSRILIPPKNTVDVRIVFNPKREEIKKFVKKMGSVLTLANMRVIYGDEPNRQRIRRLLPQLPENARSQYFVQNTDMLWSNFPQELEISDLGDIKEDPRAVPDLISCFHTDEILLTINNDNMDDTFDASTLFLTDVDETVLFRTVCAAADSPTPSSNLSTVHERFEDDADLTTKVSNWSVSPQTLTINLHQKDPVIFYIRNGFKTREFFDIVCNLKEILRITPHDGYIAENGGDIRIKVALHEHFKYPSKKVYLMVYMNNERIMMPVHITK